MGEKRIDLGLTALDELFMTEEGRQENRLPRIRQIPLDMIDDMPDHPFKVRRDDDMELLIESVREHGVITPIIVRQKEDGRYETAAGHRRRMASKINGLTTIPAEVREMTRDEAIIIMCESNLQRTKILPSEKAFSYRMRLEAMKRQAGRPRKGNSAPVGQKLSREALAEQTGDSHSQIQRFIRLTHLIPELLIESVREHGVITPIIVRQKEDGRYETAAGHRRRMASKINGLTEIPAEVRDMTRDEAIIIMCESNLQRTKILPSEKAFSYKMRLDAMNRQGKRILTSAPVGQKLSREVLAEQTGDSHSQIQRYIRLTYLIPELLKMVDEESIAFRPAVELSYLSEQEQRDLVETIGYEDATPSQSQAIQMREMSKAGTLTMDAILNIMSQKKPNQKEKISFQTERLKPYLPKNITPKQTEEYILKALEYYHRYRERMKERGDR